MNWHECFRYAPVTGVLIWKERPREHFPTEGGWICFNSRNANTAAGHHETSGYVSVRVDYKPYRAHRIIWEMHNGPIPAGMQIDHIDMDRSNNRLENLRLANNAQNNSNRGLQSNNTSGFKGVYWDPERRKWVAVIKLTGKTKRIGRYSTKGLAAVARAKAALRYHGQFARLT